MEHGSKRVLKCKDDTIYKCEKSNSCHEDAIEYYVKSSNPKHRYFDKVNPIIWQYGPTDSSKIFKF
jgi:hypothetical protein